MNVESYFAFSAHELEPYEPPDWEGLAARAGLVPDALLRLDSNENPYGLSPCAAEALARFGGYGCYPDYRALMAAIARYVGVPAQNIVLGNGGDEAIDLAVRLFVAPGDGVIVCPPAFSEYATCTKAHRGRLLNIPRYSDFSLDVEGIEVVVTGGEIDVRPKVLFLTSPGNPDGLPIPLETIVRLLKLPVIVVVDEAYIEFGGETSVPLLEAHENLIVLRTFSKWAGLAGLRLGYIVASPEVAGAMARLRHPYNVNAAAVVAALATLEDMDHARTTIDRVISERERLNDALSQLPGVQPFPSQANFVLCRLPGRSGREVADALAAQGILVRSFSDPSLADALRITVGLPEQSDAVIAMLRSVLQGTPMPQPVWRAGQPAARRGRIHRQTRETDVSVALTLDGTGSYTVHTGLGFLDHLLAQFAAHGLFDLNVRARGDLHIDEHHTVEDVAIALGQALDQALGERKGIVRMGQAYAPLDETLARVVVDLSGRPYTVVEVEFGTPRVGAMDADLVVHLMETLAFHARMSLHAHVLYGRNDHHKAEALFKALGRALDAASRLDPRRDDIPSTKGVL
jgi:histidinol-phosphate aminotransferase